MSGIEIIQYSVLVSNTNEGCQLAALIIITSLLLFLLLFHYKVEHLTVATIA